MYKLAVEHGAVDALHSLGEMYFNGKNFTEAAKWRRQFAAQQNTNWRWVIYIKGLGVPQDYVRAHM